MSISSEITRLQNAKSALATSIGNKGVAVPASTKLDGYSALVDQIQTGGGGSDDEWVRPSNWPDYSRIPMSSIGTDELYMTFDCRPAIAGNQSQGLNFRVIADGGYTVERGYIGDNGFVAVASTDLASRGYYLERIPTDEGDFVVYRVSSTTDIVNLQFGAWGGYIGNRSLPISRFPCVEMYGKLEHATYMDTGMVTLQSFCVSLKSLTSINNLFSGCISLVNVETSLIDTSEVTTMNSTFNACENLRHINVSSWDISKVSNMGSVFSNCSLLESIEGIENWDTRNVTNISNMFSACRNLAKLDIKNWRWDALTTNQLAFSTLYINKIEFASTLNLVSAQAFSNCQLCITYIFHSTTPPTMENTNAFTNINSDAKIYVPDESVNAYKTATNWSTYASYIYPLSEYTE